MDNPKTLETAAEQLQKVATTLQKAADVLHTNNLTLGHAASHLVGSGGNLDSWSGQGATAFLGACDHIQQTSSKCMTGLDQAISSCQSAVGSINNALPALYSAQSASQQAESGGINEGTLKALEEGNKIESDLTSHITALSQALELATASLGTCDKQEQSGESTDGGNPVLKKLVDIAKEDVKDNLQESLQKTLLDGLKEWQKKHSQSGSHLLSHPDSGTV